MSPEPSGGLATLSAPAPAAATVPAKRGHGFGTMPVFLAAISTILGAIMFLRFGYAVGHQGFLGALLVIIIGHLVTVPTALAVSEIATNRRVEGGGEYFVISRSFGLRIGAAIGIALYLSQAVSVAFYCIAFAEAFRPLAASIESALGIGFDPRMISVPTILFLLLLMLSKGADLGVKVLYLVVAVLAAALILFFLGNPVEGADGLFHWDQHIEHYDAFAVVFAICFPAFTGMTAGVGLSGDLARPSRSIPVGTLAATLVGGIIYVGIVWKLSVSATPQMLSEDQLIMSRIAVWGPIIPIGLGCATLSSAIGSILVAPRTLQALGRDGGFPLRRLNVIVARGRGAQNEPRTATMLTAILALAIATIGDVDAVARMISMFFMVTYGALCTISFLEHFAASPSYRPSFRSRWYVSLCGAVMCLLMMMQMDPLFAILSLAVMTGFYWVAGSSPAAKEGQDLRTIFRGAMQQATRRMNVQIQRWHASSPGIDWRPSIVCLDARKTTGSRANLQLLGWLCERLGFGTYLRLVEGDLDEATMSKSKEVRTELVEICERDFPGVYAGAIISPSRRAALAQTLQMPGVSGMENNTVLFDFEATDPPETVERVVRSAILAGAAKRNLLFLRHGEHRFGRRRDVHVWLTWHDTANATLMMLLVYILVGHRDWADAEVSVFAAFPHWEVGEERERFVAVLQGGRIPVNPSNVRFHTVEDGEAFRKLVEKTSARADLVVMGLTLERLREKGADLVKRHPALGEVLFVLAAEKVLIE